MIRSAVYVFRQRDTMSCTGEYEKYLWLDCCADTNSLTYLLTY